MMQPDDFLLSIYRYNALFNFALNIFLQFSFVIHNLGFNLGLVALSFVASRWLHQHMKFYSICWNITVAVVVIGGLMSIGIPMFFKDISCQWLISLEEVLWLTLLLATLPSSSGRMRRKILEAFKKLSQRWATGIPISS